MKMMILAAVALLAACAGHAPPLQIETRDVAVTADARAALDLALAQICEWVRYGTRADILLQHAAGIAPIEQRVREPVCAGRPSPPH